MKPELNMLYVHSKSIGYGRMGMSWAEELERLGVDVYDDLPGAAEHALDRADKRHGVDVERRSKVCHTALWASVPTHAKGWWKGQRPVIATMWEATNLPESFRENLHEFDQVIVPCEQNVELFSAYHSNIAKVTLGIDPEHWGYVERTKPSPFFNFLIGGSGARKGVDLAYKAFNALWGEPGSWGSGPEPRMIFKSPKPLEFSMTDQMEWVGGRISDDEERDLYARAHCYLQPSRGEGFGLQPLQAIAQGLPTILTDASGQAEYAHLGRGIGASLAPAAYFIYGDAGEWWEPSFDDLCDQMRWVYENYADACAEAKANSEIARRDFSWEASTRSLCDTLGWDSLTTPGPEQREWYEPTSKRFLVVTNKDWKADIAGSVYLFRAGEPYWEPADVKRILFEAGILHPACLEGDGTGLLPAQIERMGNYSASHGHCPTCGQTLNTGERR